MPPTSDDAPSAPGAPAFSERWVLFALTSIHFAHILDFVIMMPLGPRFMRVFGIGSEQFGVLVSSYSVSAGVAGLIGSLFLDRFGRRKAILGLQAGFILGTFACGLADSYEVLLVARALTGVFGGLVGAQVIAAVGDLFPAERRGAATGIVLSAFPVASVAGVPLGLIIAGEFGWRWPFLGIALLSVAFLAVAWRALPAMPAHEDASAEAFWRAPQRILQRPNSYVAFLFLLFIVLTSFSLIPYIAPYLVSNVGLLEEQLPIVYLLGGAAAFFSSRLFGRMSDRYGKRRMFLILAVAALVPILGLTHMPPLPLHGILLVTTSLFVLMPGRVVPAWAMITGSVPTSMRGSFMSLISAVQQFSAGLAAYIGGKIIRETVDGRLLNYPLVGYLAVGTTLVAFFLALRLRTVEDSTD